MVQKRMGRKRLPPGEKKTRQVLFNVRPDEFEHMQSAMGLTGQTISHFARDAVAAHVAHVFANAATSPTENPKENE